MRQPNTVEKSAFVNYSRTHLRVSTVLVYNVNTTEFGDTVRWLGPCERFILINGDHIFSRCEFNGQTRWLDTPLISFRSRNLARKTTKHTVILFNCM